MSNIVKHDGRASEQEIFARLRQPFTDEAIKWKIQTNPKESDTFALCVAYIDARDVAARLNEVVGINWESSFGELILFSDDKKSEWGVQCRLTVMGHTRTDIGTLPATEPLKGGYSDALKRAAVQFGIAAYVYSFPVVKAEVQKYGRSYYFTANAKKELFQLVQIIHSGTQRLPKFRAIQVRDYAPIRFDSPYFGTSEEMAGEGVDGDVDEQESVTTCEGCSSPIQAVKTMSAAKIAEGTREKYGRPLCWHCAQQAKKAAEQAEEGKAAAVTVAAKSDAKKNLEDARAAYEAATAAARLLGIIHGHTVKYRSWDASRLISETEQLVQTVQDAISSAATQDNQFIVQEGQLPAEDAPLDEWLAVVAAWELLDVIKADNQEEAEMSKEEMAEEVPY